MGNNEASELLLQKAAEAVRAVDPAAFPVPARIVRRVIRSERDISRFGMQIPHRKSYVIATEELLHLVEPDELGIAHPSEVPHPAILIAQPGEEKLAGLTLKQLLVRYWMLLFHARIDATLAAKVASGELTPALIRERIDQIGQVEFDEMHAVIREEDFLLPPEDFTAAYIEAAAVYLQLRYFDPHRLGAFFPSLDDYPRMDAIFGQDLDVLYLLETTRPEGAPPPEGLRKHEDDEREADPKRDRKKSPRQPADASALEAATSPAEFREPAMPNQKLFDRLIHKANRVSEAGNAVRAALLRLHAAKHAPLGQSGETSIAAMGELEQLSRRLQAALGFDDEQAEVWRDVMISLLAKSTEGFWSADKRLLYDLQKVCNDHEREISHIDLLGWIKSAGQQPLRRTLPNQREVRINKHLRRALSRLTAIRLSGPERDQLSHLLHEAVHQVEGQLRARLRPLIAQALDDVGLQPQNLPERVSRRKIIEELLDKIVQHGLLNMSMLRDAMSRNHLKMPDLSGPQELVGGDWLLQADRRLKVLLEGVYRRGEFYLRGLQKVSSITFGTPAGRFATIYLAVPFGGAVVVLEGLKHLFDKLYGVAPEHDPEALAESAEHVPGEAIYPTAEQLGADQPTHLLSWFDPGTPGPFLLGIVLLGAFLCGMIHVRPFRLAVFEFFKSVFMGVRRLVFDLPRWFWQHEFLRKIFRSRPVRWLRRYVFYPLILTGLVWMLLPDPASYGLPRPVAGGVLFFLFALALNSRTGRDIEELTTERLYQVWDHIRVKWFIALFEAVVNFFKRVLETFERFMYAVDELLRFRSGQNLLTLLVKSVLGLVWAVVAFFVRAVVTLLIEPQVNPIKHFPVVTVSHKFLVPLSPMVYRALLPWMGHDTAIAATGVIIFLTPGVFGFLVWEFKENWKLYGANRKANLKPVLVGSHGESMIRLMKPGFHSGTIPRIFKKLRRIDRHRRPARRNRLRVRYEEKLHHTLDDIRHFIERELLVLLEESRQFGEKKLSIQNIRVASNNIRVAIACEGSETAPLELAFQEQSGWLMVGILEPGWLDELKVWHRQTFKLALAGFYKLAGVDVVREQLRGCFGPALPPYDVMDRGLVLWPDGAYQVEVRYDLYQRPWLRPRPRTLARHYDLPMLEANHALYCELPISWDTWVACWEAEQSMDPMPKLFDHEVHLLPSQYLIPSSHAG